MALFGSKVSDFMGSMKIDREIAELESKKLSLVKSISNEILSIQAKVSEKFKVIGSTAYDAHKSGNLSLEQFNESFSEIAALNASIEEKQAKKDEITNRYNEEITLLRNLTTTSGTVAVSTFENSNADIVPSTEVRSVTTNCRSCGTPRKIVDIFCKNCGAKL